MPRRPSTTTCARPRSPTRRRPARIARLYRDGEGGVAANVVRYVGWMQYAAALGHAEASYELAVWYRKSSLPALAAPYEARAEELGFKPPPTLDHIRK